MKKILALVLMLALALSVVPANAETDWHAKEKYTLNWTQYYVTPSAEDAITIKYLEDKFNVDINVLPIEDSNFMEVLNTYIVGGDIPDVMRLKDPAVFTTYVDQDVLGAIDMDLVKEYFPTYYKAMTEYEDGIYLTYGSVDGTQYGLPAISGGNMFHLPVVYNKTWMENVGVTETPKTLDELHTLMQKFTFEDPDKDGVQDTYGLSSDGMRNVFGAYGINPGAADGRTDHSAFQVIDGQLEYV
ncbi:MAG: extracellular solute-binding protein, partial [Clostridia bacterium]|nr:extracellular solute-binding protein [Clostridia bacterium]